MCSKQHAVCSKQHASSCKKCGTQQTESPCVLSHYPDSPLAYIPPLVSGLTEGSPKTSVFWTLWKGQQCPLLNHSVEQKPISYCISGQSHIDAKAHSEFFPSFPPVQFILFSILFSKFESIQNVVACLLIHPCKLEHIIVFIQVLSSYKRVIIFYKTFTDLS